MALIRKIALSKTGKTYYNYYVRRDGLIAGIDTPSFSYVANRRETASGRITHYIKTNAYNGKLKGKARFSKLHRLKALERDNYTCQMCGGSNNLDVHHEDNKGSHLIIAPNHNLENLKTLCHSCHLKLHYGVIDKAREIIARRENGETFQQIADHYGVSRQRIHQIVRKNTLKILDK